MIKSILKKNARDHHCVGFVNGYREANPNSTMRQALMAYQEMYHDHREINYLYDVHSKMMRELKELYD